jgi:uncharacterized protein YndB with AHSA1/START domain
VTETGTMRSDGAHFELRFERILSAPPERVWQALTEEEDLVTWFPVAIQGRWEKGEKLSLAFREDEGPPLDGEVLECSAPRLLAFRWGEEILRFELAPADGDRCHLVFVNTFDDGGKAARDSAGWHLCLDALEQRLLGRQPPSMADRWDHVYGYYVARLGPEHATAEVPGP